MVFQVTVVNEGAGSVIRRFEYMLAPELRRVVTVPSRTCPTGASDRPAHTEPLIHRPVVPVV